MRPPTLNQQLSHAAANEGLEDVQRLLAAGADPTYRNSEALRYAVRYNTLSVVKALVDAGADIEAFGGSTLQYAAGSRCDPDMVKYLLSAGADPRRNQSYALSFAVEAALDWNTSPSTKNSAKECVKLLLAAGADPTEDPVIGVDFVKKINMLLGKSGTVQVAKNLLGRARETVEAVIS